MKITLQYYGQLRQLADRDSEQVEIEGAPDLASVLRKVVPKYEERFSRILFSDGQRLSASVMMLVNNEPAGHNPAPVVRDGDVVSLFPAISGG